MALLNLTAFTPQMAFSVCSTLNALGGSADADLLQSWMAPAPLYVGSDAPRTAGLGLREAVTLCETAGLITRVDGTLSITKPVSSAAEFRRELRDAVMAPERNKKLFGTKPAGGIKAHELTRALTWFMQLRSSLGPFSTANYEKFQDSGLRVIENDSRWAVFDRWVVFLGFGWRTTAGLMPDPTVVVVDYLDEILAAGSEVSLPQFLKDVASRIPVVDGGAYHAAYLAALDNQDRDERRVSEPLSLALMRLQRRGLLEFFGGGDAEARTFRLGSDVDSTSQFVRRTTVSLATS